MHNIEHAVVGAAMLTPDIIPAILTQITPNDLYDPKAEAALTAIADMWVDGTPIDPLGVAQKLSGGPMTAADIFDMVQIAIPAGAVTHHVTTIAEKAAVRRLGAAGEKISMLSQSGETPDVILQHAQDLLDGAIRTTESDVHIVADTIGATLDGVAARHSGEDEPGLPTGFPDLDDILGGLSGGQMIVVAARPGYGKTTLAVDIIRHNSIKNRTPSMMFSLEMGKDELNLRMLAAESGVLLGDLVSGKAAGSPTDWGNVNAAALRIAESPIFVDTTEEPTIHSITSKARLYVEKHNIGLIVLDYLQLLRSSGKTESREQEIATYSRAMKLLAKACNVPVIVVAQLNRDSVKHGRKPQVSDIRESGALEQDADVILLLDNPATADPDHPRAGEIDVIVGKNRRGRTGTATLGAQLHYSRFASLYRD